MNKILLYILMSPSAVWQRLGADNVQLKAILSAKLKTDDRKPLTFGRRRKTKNSKFNSFLNMLIYFFIGFMYVLPLAMKDTLFGLFCYYAIFLFMLTFSLTTDFSGVITDTKDKLILLPRPINDKTLILSRYLHTFIYLLRIVFPMSLAGWIVLGIDKGWKAVVLFPLPLLMMLLLALFFVNACYLIILKFTKTERFQNIINSFQIAFSVIIVVFVYLIQGVMKSSAIQNLDITSYSWIKLTPPFWLASCWTWIGINTAHTGLGLYGILALLVPPLCLYITLKWLSPTFTKKLSAIDGMETEYANPKKGSNSSYIVYKVLANRFNNNDAAKAGFMITWLQTTRSRSFKMRVYPALVYIPVYFLYLLLMRDEPLKQVWQQLPQTKQYLTLLYMSAFALIQALNYVTMSDQYKAAWVYYSSPIEKPGNVIAGAYKALWLKYYLPFITLIGLFVLYTWGLSAIVDVLLATVNVSLFSLCIMRIGNKSFPFSIMEQMKNTGGKTMVRILSTFLLIGVLGFSHYLAFFLWLKVLFMILSCLFFWLVWDSYKNTSWNNLRIAEEAK
jgi:ABC-2 type transport system permease protein